MVIIELRWKKFENNWFLIILFEGFVVRRVLVVVGFWNLYILIEFWFKENVIK